jgi:hypothetical protein
VEEKIWRSASHPQIVPRPHRRSIHPHARE